MARIALAPDVEPVGDAEAGKADDAAQNCNAQVFRCLLTEAFAVPLDAKSTSAARYARSFSGRSCARAFAFVYRTSGRPVVVSGSQSVVSSSGSA